MKKKPYAFLDAILPDQESMLKVAIEWIGLNLNPEDVFDKDTLEDWAYSHGFIEDDD
jgi:hypothetical protein